MACWLELAFFNASSLLLEEDIVTKVCLELPTISISEQAFSWDRKGDFAPRQDFASCHSVNSPDLQKCRYWHVNEIYVHNRLAVIGRNQNFLVSFAFHHCQCQSIILYKNEKFIRVNLDW